MERKVLVWGKIGWLVREDEVEKVEVPKVLTEKENVVAWSLNKPLVESREKTVWLFGEEIVVWVEQFVLRGSWEDVERAVEEWLMNVKYDVVKVYIAEVREGSTRVAEVRSDMICKVSEVRDVIKKMLKLLKSRV